MDYSIRSDEDGRGSIQPWEINVSPTIGRGVKPGGGLGPRELWPIRTETREFFFDRFREAWIDVDSVPPGLPAVEVTFDPAVVEEAARRRATEGLARRVARGLLQPVKPLLRPVASKLLGHLAAHRR